MANTIPSPLNFVVTVEHPRKSEVESIYELLLFLLFVHELHITIKPHVAVATKISTVAAVSRINLDRTYKTDTLNFTHFLLIGPDLVQI